MNIIKKTPNASGAHSAPQTWNWEWAEIPDGYAVIADTVDMTDFYAHNGFVTLIIGDGTVTAYTPNIEAWEAWKASLPEPSEPEPSLDERLDALEAQVAQADETAIELYEMQLAQEEINAAQDDALIEIYEMIGG